MVIVFLSHPWLSHLIDVAEGESEKKDQNEEFFGRPAYLTVRNLVLTKKFESWASLFFFVWSYR